jgi:hypothetical protein
MISLRNVRASLARLISPPGLLTVAIPDSGTGTPPAMRIVAQAAPVAPVAAAPRFRRAPVGPNGLSAFQEKLQIEARLKTEFGWHEKLEAAGVDYKARRKVLADFDRFVAGRPPGKSTAPKSGTVDDEGNVPVPTPPPDSGDGLDAVIKILLDGVEKLRLLLPADVDADDGDFTQAKAYLAIGSRKEALAAASRAHSRIGEQLAAHQDPRARAHAKMFANLHALKPLAIEAHDDVPTRRAKATKHLFQNLN